MKYLCILLLACDLIPHEQAVSGALLELVIMNFVQTVFLLALWFRGKK